MALRRTACIGGRTGYTARSIIPDIERTLAHARMATACRRHTMAVPKSKVTRMKRGHRRSTDALKAPTYVEDRNSGELRRPHHIDLKTGMYRGRQVLEPKDAV